MNTFREDFIARQKRWVIDIVVFSRTLPDNEEIQVIRGQLLRSSTSVGANYRAACRAKSRSDFINKLMIVEEQGDESLYWLELIRELRPSDGHNISKLISEGNEILSIVIKARQTAKANQHK